jgi:hypothetical protein
MISAKRCWLRIFPNIPWRFREFTLLFSSIYGVRRFRGRRIPSIWANGWEVGLGQAFWRMGLDGSIGNEFMTYN